MIVFEVFIIGALGFACSCLYKIQVTLFDILIELQRQRD